MSYRERLYEIWRDDYEDYKKIARETGLHPYTLKCWMRGDRQMTRPRIAKFYKAMYKRGVTSLPNIRPQLRLQGT